MTLFMGQNGLKDYHTTREFSPTQISAPPNPSLEVKVLNDHCIRNSEPNIHSGVYFTLLLMKFPQNPLDLL